MRAVVYTGPKAVRVAEVPDPLIEVPTDALVRVSLSAICGTDLHVISGRFPGMQAGATVGHEFVGDVVEVGSAVQRFKRGDHVMGSDFTACGRCRWCDRGDHWECAQRGVFGTGSIFGPALGGAQAELMRVPLADVTLAPVPAGCGDPAALLIGDNLAAAWVAIERSLLTPGESVAVIGGGSVGQLTALSAQTAGAGIVVLVEPNQERRRLAQAHGSLAATLEEAPALIKRLTDGDGADVVVDCVGGRGPLETAFALVRRRGRVVSTGVHADPTWSFPVARGFNDELSLSFALGDSIRLRTRLAALISGKAMDPTIVISKVVPLDAVPQAYQEFAAQQVLKVAIDPRL
ncbi:MAG: alcohol dehydrogenase catalytic domain-containing protein [Burkholderiales bacterium]|nr:alcohol dehydrogenase catalytic domain-containing protein [Burkholderiales bacterium]